MKSQLYPQEHNHSFDDVLQAYHAWRSLFLGKQPKEQLFIYFGQNQPRQLKLQCVRCYRISNSIDLRLANLVDKGCTLSITSECVCGCRTFKDYKD